MKSILFSITLGSLVFVSHALTLDSALQMALSRNPTVQAEMQVLAGAETDVTWGKVGLYPKLEAQAGYTQSLSDTRQKRGVGVEEVNNGTEVKALTAGLNANWTVFEGLKAPASLTRLRVQRDLAALKLSETRLDVAAKTAEAFYLVLRERELLFALDTLTLLTGERFRLSQARFKAGSISRQEGLDAEADHTAQQAAHARQGASLKASVVGLKQWLNLENAIPSDSLAPESLVDPGDPLLKDLATLREGIEQRQPEIRRAALADALAKAGLKEYLADLWPKLTLNAGWNFALNRYSTDNPGTNFLRSSETLGPSVGAQVKVNLFDGFATRRDWRKAKASEREAEFRIAAAQLKVNADLTRSESQGKGCIEALALEKRYRSLAAEASKLMLERQRAGAVSAVEAHQSEERYQAASQRAITQRHECRMNDLNLLRAAGKTLID